MAPHDQRDIDAIFARSSRKRVSVEPVRQLPTCVSRLGILDTIQPSLTRSYSTAHLGNMIQLQGNRENSQTAANAVNGHFPDNATEQHTVGTPHEPLIVQQHTAFKDNDNESTSSKSYPDSRGQGRSLPAGDLGRLNDASLSTALAQQMLSGDDLTVDYTTGGSTSLTHESMMLDSPESMSSFEEIQTLTKLTSTVGKQLSGLRALNPTDIQDSSQQKKQLHQHHAPNKSRNLARIVHTTCADHSTGTHDLSKSNRELEASTKAKIRASQEQAVQDAEDARAEREMHDMDHEYQNQMEIRRQNLAKMEHDAQIKRSIASAADARRVVKSRAVADCGRNGKHGRNGAGGSVLASVIREEISDSGERSKVKNTLPTYPPNRSISQTGITAPPHSTAQEKTREIASHHNDLQKHNGNIADNRKTERSSLDHQNDAKQKLRIAAQQVRKQMAERERIQYEGRRKLIANSLQDCHTSSPVPGTPQNVSYDQGCSKSICVIEASEVDDATRTTADVSKVPGAVAHWADTPPLIAAESGSATQPNVNALPKQSPGGFSTTIGSSNTTVSKSKVQSTIMENQILERAVRDAQNKLSRSMSTQLSPNDSESVLIIDDATTSPDLPQSQHNNDNINSLRPPKAAETTLQTLVNSEHTSPEIKRQNGGNEEDVISTFSPEIATGPQSIDVELSSRIGEYTLGSITSPTVLDKYGNDHTDSVNNEEDGSLFGDSYSDTETHRDVAERCQLPQSSEEIDIGKASVQESQQGSKIIGQWAIVEADDSKDNTNQTSMKDSENLLIMQMLDIESKTPHTRTISAQNPVQQYAPNKRQKLEIHARGLTGNKNETVYQDNSKLIHQPIEPEAVEPCTSNKGRRANITTPERMVAKRQAVMRQQQKKKRDTLQQGSRRSNQSTPEPISLHAMSSGLNRHQTMGKPQARGFAALNGTPTTKSRKIAGQNDIPGAEGSRHGSVPLSRRNMHLSYDERIAAIKHQLSAYDPQGIQDVEPPEDDHTDVEVLSLGQDGPPMSYAYESSSSSDEDEDEEQAKQRRLLKHSSSATAQKAPCNPVPETPDSARPTYARKGIGRKTIASEANTNNDIHKDPSSEAEPEECDSSPPSDSDTTEEDMLWHYSVTRQTRQSNDSDSDAPFLAEPCGTFLTKNEANAVAHAALHALLPSLPLEHSVTLRSNAAGLLTCLYSTPATDVEIRVSRSLHRRARLPAAAARLPLLVYAVSHRVITRFRAPARPDTYSCLHLGTFALLDLANRVAGRAWLAHELRQLPPGAYAQEVCGLGLRNEMRVRLDALEVEGGFFKSGGRVVRGVGEGEEEVEVWVEEREVQGPRN
ncbi:hypothetical protein MMC17_000813 [Xylographa soralifera]|nr:hypothetical protein [Xylographa soralifera]